MNFEIKSAKEHCRRLQVLQREDEKSEQKLHSKIKDLEEKLKQVSLQLADRKKKNKEIANIEKCEEMVKLEEELRKLEDEEMNNLEPIKP